MIRLLLYRRTKVTFSYCCLPSMMGYPVQFFSLSPFSPFQECSGITRVRFRPQHIYNNIRHAYTLIDKDIRSRHKILILNLINKTNSSITLAFQGVVRICGHTCLAHQEQDVRGIPNMLI